MLLWELPPLLKPFHVHVKEIRLARSLFPSFLLLLTTFSSIEPLCYPLQSDE